MRKLHLGWRRCARPFVLLVLGALPLLPPASAAPDDDAKLVRIAVRAHSGAAHALKRWGPTAEHLTASIPGYRFTTVPFENISALNEAVSRDEFDFVLTNPASYVEYRMRNGVHHLATLVNDRQGRPYTQFGSVIFTRADRADINTLQDLKGKTFMAVSEQGFGGWRVAWRELRHQGIEPYDQFSKLMFAGGTQPRVVDAVAQGEADAGTVRTDMLERLAAAGLIRLADFKVLNPRQTEGFPFAHSTPLYPEWPFARFPHTDDRLAEQVTRALLNITPDTQAARSGQYLGWHTPLDYEPVRELLEELGVGPYTGSGTITAEHLLRDYGVWIALGLVVVVLLSLLLLRLALLNDRLRETKAQLQAMAMHDGLTGLANRHRLDDFLAQAWRQAMRHRHELSAVLFDIDKFKQYNDHYGHVVGDDCLRQVAAAATGQFRRANDLVARYGGEEFLVILIDTGSDEALRQAEALRQRIAELRIPHATSEVADHLTISIGVATCVPRSGLATEDLISAADRALYQAKSGGRNRVVRAPCERVHEPDPSIGHSRH